MTAGSLRRRINPQILSGVFFLALFGWSLLEVYQLKLFVGLGLSPRNFCHVLGIVYGNTIHKYMPATAYHNGILFSSKTLLRLAIILYGFRLTFQDLMYVGLSGFVLSAFMLTTTFLLGSFLGIRVFKLSRPLTFLTVAGSSVCGAAAVLATEPVVKGKNYETSIAVGTVVIFGTVAMFIYPFIFESGLLNLNVEQYGAYVGSTLHEVAHVVAAGQVVSQEAGIIAVIVKMIRVILIAPLLITLGMWIRKNPDPECDEEALLNEYPDDPHPCLGGKYTFKTFPWFAVLFIVCVGFNSLQLLPQNVVDMINTFDIFLLTMAMCALGMETNLEKIRNVGPKPFILAAILAVYLMVGGYFATLFFFA